MAKKTPTCHKCGKSRFGAKYIDGILLRECKDCEALFDTIKNVPFIKSASITRANALINSELNRLIREGCQINNLRLHISPASPLADKRIMESNFGELGLWVGEYIPKGIAYIMGEPGHKPRGFAWISSNVRKIELEVAKK